MAQRKQAVKRQGRRPVPTNRRTTSGQSRSQAKQLTLGDLIAAAFDVAGNEGDAIKVLQSSDIACATGTRLIFE